MRGDEIEFEPALRERVALLKGMPVSVVDEVLAKRITPTPGGRELVMTMRAHGAYTCLISGGLPYSPMRFAAMIGFEENRANELLVADGKLTGEVREPILAARPKLATLIELRESFDLDNLDTLVVGGRRQRSRHDPGRRPRRRLPRQTRRLPRRRRGSITAISPHCSTRRGIGGMSCGIGQIDFPP